MPDLRTAPPEVLPVEALTLAHAGEVALPDVREAADRCRACDLWSRATQTVFGAGPVPARLMLVGEQPGDQEDVAGAPFVGPAGRVLHEAGGAPGDDHEQGLRTNVAKHLKI